MKTIPLTKGYVALVDDDDYERIVALGAWQVQIDESGRRIYAIRNRETWMHREVLQAKDGEIVDHRNCDGLDNRRENLRLATTRENGRNSRKGFRPNWTSIWKGVSISRLSGRFEAKIATPKRHYLGSFRTPLEAARAYDHAAHHFFGEFARLNLPHLLHIPPPIGIPHRCAGKRIEKRPGQHKGVRKRGNRWIATIYNQKRHIYLGMHPTPEQAALAYNEAAIRLHGRNAVLNKIPT